MLDFYLQQWRRVTLTCSLLCCRGIPLLRVPIEVYRFYSTKYWYRFRIMYHLILNQHLYRNQFIYCSKVYLFFFLFTFKIDSKFNPNNWIFHAILVQGTCTYTRYHLSILKSNNLLSQCILNTLFQQHQWCVIWGGGKVD